MNKRRCDLRKCLLAIAVLVSVLNTGNSYGENIPDSGYTLRYIMQSNFMDPKCILNESIYISPKNNKIFLRQALLKCGKNNYSGQIDQGSVFSINDTEKYRVDCKVSGQATLCSNGWKLNGKLSMTFIGVKVASIRMGRLHLRNKGYSVVRGDFGDKSIIHEEIIIEFNSKSCRVTRFIRSSSSDYIPVDCTVIKGRGM